MPPQRTVASPGEKPWVREIRTTAGDLERESRTRLYNLLEAVGMMTFILVLLWPLAYLFGVLGKHELANTVANILIFLGALYLLFVAPFVHRDTLHSWGLGNPRVFWRMLCHGTPLQRLTLAAVSLFLLVGLNYANFVRWPDVAHFFKFANLLGFFGFRNLDVNHWNHSFPGVIFVVFFGSLLSLVIITFCIRYDNFTSAFKTAMIVALPMLAFTFLAAYFHRGAAAFAHFSLGMWAIGVFGYVFWGFVQQLLFSSYFGTRFRKAFGPSRDPNNVIPKERRPRVVAGFGAGFAIVAVVLTFLGTAYLYGVGSVAPSVFCWQACILFLMGSVYGYVFCLDKRRLLVATICATCFGLIHVASYGLVAVTWILGIILVYVFMEEKNRNLVALGFIHGLLGSTFGQLFSHGDAGSLEVNYSVGPWNIDEPTYGVLVFPLLCIAAYLAFMAWSINNIQEDPE